MYKQIVKEDELNLIFRNTTNEIFVADGQGICIQVNPECEKNLGIDAASLIGTNVKDLVSRGLFTNSTTLKVLEEKKPVSLIQETSIGQKLYATGIPVFAENGEISRVISTSINITEILKFQEKVQRMELMLDDYNKELASIKKTIKFNQGEIIASSHHMKRVYEMLEMITQVDSTILLLGESGVGKSEIAHWIHKRSNRSNKKLIEVNCAAIPSNLFESELFGYEPGAFSGALSSGKRGLALEADKGTLFLDEIGELSLELQSKILQFIQSKSFRKVGGNKTEKSDVRIITATNRNLEQMVNKGKFREDLYYRLSVIPIKIPPLRERKEDLIALIFLILDNLNISYDKKYTFSNTTIQSLLNHQWPGNIRELKNTIERICVTSKDEYIDLDKSSLIKYLYFNNSDYINEEIPRRSSIDNDESITNEIFSLENDMSLKDRVKWFEYEIVNRYYKKYKSTQQVAEVLKTSQSTISRKLNQVEN
ncbi:sigma-54 interaction domain-containing protein [Psychrobacillus soli]|uniref:HTH-type transcriptional regulatory protein TyrR n=1 Tax=Psychrobacillus soli TaxID=1543965 RepID=A0A544T4B9_9BACI|nr:sigma 54-interacting transcriptional regulator [Psychrobacillus soli]TQR12310.1 PAS domain S-box protein [Psychrobacillus soli]